MDNLTFVELFSAAARIASANGAGADLKTYAAPGPGNRQMKAIITCGAASGTTPTLDVKLQESDDNSTFTDIPGAAFTQLTAAGSEEIGVQTNKRYLRAVATIGGSTPSFTFAVLLIAGKRHT